MSAIFAAPGSNGSAPRIVALLAADGEWGARLDADELALARRGVVLPRIDLPAGPWAWGTAERRGLGVLVLDGVILRETAIAGRTAAQVCGAGDVLVPAAPNFGELSLEVTWSVKEPAVVAVLDARFAAATRRWPQIGEQLRYRLANQGVRTATEAAIVQLPRVEQRLLAMLWHLAERFGRVGPEGVGVGLRLTHSELGRLVGAQRPTVTLALNELVEREALLRPADGRLILKAGGLETLMAVEAPAVSVAA